MRNKQFFCIVFVLSFFLILCGCNEDEKNTLQNVIDQEVQAEECYTPISYAQYTAARNSAQTTAERTFATVRQLSAAQAELQSAIDALCPRANKNDLSALIKSANVLDEEKYTTRSCTFLRKTLSDVSTVMRDANSTQQEVEQAEVRIRNSLNQMVPATKGLYQINCSLSMEENHHVGNEWQTSIKYNGREIRNGDFITVPLDSVIEITGTVIESDNIPDRGRGTVTLNLQNHTSGSKIITVRENRGRYSGNIAVWKLSCSATLIERK